ncbi:MAG: PEP-CTERM sorting domain-containing protein [Burkholderiales bacterium]|nr:PEP-CTERM sorting domain-containing protein [Burkholderiales bacterium]
MGLNRTIFVTTLLLLVHSGAHAAIATFDDLPAPPGVDAGVDLPFANGDSASYQGVIWDPRFRVVGEAYRIADDAPLFGIPKSAQYFVTNIAATVGSSFNNDGLRLTTNLILTEAWFGQNEYYGFGGGADQITIHALQGDAVIGSVSLDLPDANPGEPEPLSRIDTSAFLALTGITGYRIDRRAQGEFADNWIADDFVFQAPVPEPSTLALVALGLGAVVAMGRRRR